MGDWDKSEEAARAKTLRALRADKTVAGFRVLHDYLQDNPTTPEELLKVRRALRLADLITKALAVGRKRHRFREDLTPDICALGHETKGGRVSLRFYGPDGHLDGALMLIKDRGGFEGELIPFALNWLANRRRRREMFAGLAERFKEFDTSRVYPIYAAHIDAVLNALAE